MVGHLRSVDADRFENVHGVGDVFGAVFCAEHVFQVVEGRGSDTRFAGLDREFWLSVSELTRGRS